MTLSNDFPLMCCHCKYTRVFHARIIQPRSPGRHQALIRLQQQAQCNCSAAAARIQIEPNANENLHSPSRNCMASKLRSLIIPSHGLSGLVMLCAKPGTSITAGVCTMLAVEIVKLTRAAAGRGKGVRVRPVGLLLLRLLTALRSASSWVARRRGVSQESSRARQVATWGKAVSADTRACAYSA